MAWNASRIRNYFFGINHDRTDRTSLEAVTDSSKHRNTPPLHPFTHADASLLTGLLDIVFCKQRWRSVIRNTVLWRNGTVHIGSLIHSIPVARHTYRITLHGIWCDTTRQLVQCYPIFWETLGEACRLFRLWWLMFLCSSPIFKEFVDFSEEMSRKYCKKNVNIISRDHLCRLNKEKEESKLQQSILTVLNTSRASTDEKYLIHHSAKVDRIAFERRRNFKLLRWPDSTSFSCQRIISKVRPIYSDPFPIETPTCRRRVWYACFVVLNLSFSWT